LRFGARPQRLVDEGESFNGRLFHMSSDVMRRRRRGPPAEPRIRPQPATKQILLDVAERGRSLGVILIGAQQTLSEVERRILANCAIRVAGRLDAAETERPEYGFLPPAQRARAMIAKPGTMFIAQPDIERLVAEPSAMSTCPADPTSGR